MRHAFLFVGFNLSLLACATLTAPLAALRATPTPLPSKTAKATPSRPPSPTLTPTSTATPTATTTPEPLFSATPTLLLIFPPQPTTSSGLDCGLLWQSPRNGVRYKPDQEFTVGWKISNTGTVTWDADTVEFTYLAGARLYDYDLVRLDTDVAPGEAVVLSVHMKAPSNSTSYTTYWSLRRGDTFFCRVQLSIYVQ